MAKFKIIQNKKKCIGCGTCVALCPGNWKLTDDGKASPIKAELDIIGCNQEAADHCPMRVINIIKTGDKK